MFEQVNKAVRAAIAAAQQKPHGGTPPLRKGETRQGVVRQLANYGYQKTVVAELLTLVPVETGADLRRLMSHLIVVRTTLRLDPPFSKRLVMALHHLIREVEQLDVHAAEMCTGCAAGCYECRPHYRHGVVS